MTLRFEPILTDGIAQVSYFLCDDSEGIAAVFDPRPDCEIYLKKARQYGLVITHIFETHIHADFMSGSRELLERCQGSAKIYASVEGDTSYDFEVEGVQDGYEYDFGEVKVIARHTPGHTPEHLSFMLIDPDNDQNDPWGVITGDSLFVDSIGRPDLLGDEKTEKLTQALFKTMREFFCALDDSVIIYPCHAAGSACGPNIGDRMHSTIGYEKKHNKYMQIDNYDDFKKALHNNVPPVPSHYPKMKELNVKGPKTYGHTPHVKALDVESFEKASKEEGVIIIDTRDMQGFGCGHIENALNIGKKPILSVWTGWLIDTKAPILLVLNSDEDLAEVVNLLWRTGHTNIKGYLAGGMEKWREAGKAQSQLPQLSVHDLNQSLDHYQPLDVRKDKEWQSGHIPNAQHAFVGTLGEALHNLDKNEKLATYCASGYRASIASSLLKKRGFRKVSNVMGSMMAWKAANYEIEKPDQESES